MPVIGALHAGAYSSDPHIPASIKKIPVDGFGVGLHRPFLAGGELERAQEPAQQPMGQRAGSSAAHEDGLHRAGVPHGIEEKAHLLDGLVDHSFLDAFMDGAPRHGIENAIEALVHAEGNVDVQGQGELRARQWSEAASSGRSPCR